MPLTRSQARAFYQRFGALLDWPAFYEDPAVAALERHADFEHAHSVVELGCGTGRLAARLLERRLSDDARYLAIDLAPRLVEATRARLAPFGARATAVLSDGSLRLPVEEGGADRVVAVYVVDLLSDEDIAAFLGDARRALAPEGALCVVGLTCGERGLSRLISSAWSALARVAPAAVGGCRPLLLRRRVEAAGWLVRHAEVVVSHGVATEVLVASPRVNAAGDPVDAQR